ncbi:hypothetical protein LCGC14_0750120, partial [marine sediment metagenome]
MTQQAQAQGTQQVQGIVAVTESMETAGCIVWWRLSGSTDGYALRQAWEDAGLPEDLVPELPSAEKALRRAVIEQRERRRLVRPLEGTKGWAVVDEAASGDDLDYSVRLKVTLNKIGHVSIEPEGAVGSDEIKAAYQRHLAQLAQTDISTWLVRLAARVRAVALRDTGGVYFIPREQVAQWRRMAGALGAASASRVFEVPALKSDEAIEAVLDAVAREAETAAEVMEEELAKENLGERALRTRTERCGAIEEKLSTYEKLLGTSLDALHDRLEVLQAGLATAALAAMAGDDD